MGEMTEHILLKKGAEASLHTATWNGKKVVFKTRFPKEYRHVKIDTDIRLYRTAHEPQLMNEAKKAGVPTPIVFQVDMKNSIITMEYVEGKQAKQLLGSLTAIKRQEMCEKIGQLVGKLHKHGIVHGDLTTSNMIVNREGRIFFVDFGLGEKNTELEAKGVDLHLLKRALQSTHFQFAEECFEAVIKGYTDIVGETEKIEILRKVREIEKRGRYVEGRRGNED